MLYCHAKNMYYTVDLLCFTHKSCIFSEFFPEIYLPMGAKWTINHKMHFYWHIQEENIKLSLLVAWIVLFNFTLMKFDFACYCFLIVKVKKITYIYLFHWSIINPYQWKKCFARRLIDCFFFLFIKTMNLYLQPL